MKKILIILAIVVVVVAGIWWLALRDTDTDTDSSATDTTTSDTQTTTDTTDTDNTTDGEEEATAESVTIVYTSSGFTPKNYTIKMGGTVTVRNDSDDTLDFASDDHPTHLENSELNAGTITPGETESFTVDRTGTWGFHNHEQDSHTGTIVVEP